MGVGKWKVKKKGNDTNKSPLTRKKKKPTLLEKRKALIKKKTKKGKPKYTK